PWGRSVFYRPFHQEPVRMSADPLTDAPPNPDRDPYDSNQAIPTLLATRDRQQFEKLFPNFEFIEISWFSFWVYPLSGGFKSWTLMPEFLGRRMLRLEKRIEAAL